MENNLELLFNKHKFDKSIKDKSSSWFKKQMLGMANVKSDTVLREGGKQYSSIEPGSMYMYYYSPKHRDSLEYYDTFPMVIPSSVSLYGITIGNVS